VAQVSSVIGREFTHALITRVAQMPVALLDRGLEQLVASGLVFRRGTPPDARYLFKHALVQEAAYSSLLRSHRAKIHAAIATALEEDIQIEGPQPALLGYHCAQAGWVQKAAINYRLAGDRSEARSALVETRSLLDRGLALAGTLPDSPDNRRLRAELLVTLGRILHMTKGPSDPEALVAFERAIGLSATLEDPEPLRRALVTRFLNLWRRANYEAAERDAHQLLRVETLRADPRAQVLGHVALGYVHFVRGEFGKARGDITVASELLDQHPSPEIDATFGAGVTTNGVIFGALGLACLGHLDQAAAEALSIAAQIPRLAPFARASALLLLSRFAQVTHDDESFQEHTKQLKLISEEQGFPDFANAANFGHGWLEAQAGRLDAGIDAMQASIEAMQAADYQAFGPYWRIMLADALVHAGQTRGALRVIDEALDVVCSNG
jgi:tetratricopeptide (TPR) repeat protein